MAKNKPYTGNTTPMQTDVQDFPNLVLRHLNRVALTLSNLEQYSNLSHPEQVRMKNNAIHHLIVLESLLYVYLWDSQNYNKLRPSLNENLKLEDLHKWMKGLVLELPNAGIIKMKDKMWDFTEETWGEGYD